jgi:hypothetical protein
VALDAVEQNWGLPVAQNPVSGQGVLLLQVPPEPGSHLAVPAGWVAPSQAVQRVARLPRVNGPVAGLAGEAWIERSFSSGDGAGQCREHRAGVCPA